MSTLPDWSRIAPGPWKLWQKLRSRPDTEHEQALIRLVVGAILFCYLLPGAFIHVGREREADLMYLGAMFGFLAAAAAIFWSILSRPGISRTRRVLGAAVDAGATTFFMIAAGVYALPLFLIYIWITLANGFRYGAGYLLTALAFSAAGFGIVMGFSPFWREIPAVGGGLVLGLVILAVYVLSLVRRMSAALERAEAANLAKRRFISVVSHEMRTPLNAIINMTDLLRDTPLNAEQVDMAETLAGSSRVLLGLVEDVLDFSKIEAGKLTLEDTDFDLHALVNSAAKILLSQALDKGLELIVSIMPDVAPALRGDPHHLRQVLLNLIGNAIKFTQKGSITVHVSLIAETPRGPRLKFTVRDTGIGIPEEAQQRIFDSFAQADETTTRRFGGTGLGTTIARQLVDLMGGRMGLESSVGLGSTFWFEITLGRQASAATGAEGQLGEAALLVIGFPPSERLALQEALKSWDARPRFHDLVEQAAEQVVRDIAIAPPPRAALIHASRASLAQSMLEELRRGSQLPDLPAVIALPEAARPEALHGVPGGRNVVLGLPLDRRLLFNALHAVTAAEEDRQDVVFLSDYLKRRENSSIYRILVADDNASNRTVIGKILERAGHAVHMVESGEEVLDAIEETAFDIVILDRNMPDMGGIEALKRLRFLERGRARIPVVVLSADVTSDARDESLAAGADAFLSKPIEAPRLLDLIAELGARADDAKPLPPLPPVAPAAPAFAAPPAAPRRPTLVAADSSPVLNRETLKLLEELGSDSGQHRDFMERLIAAFVKDTEQVLRSLEADAPPTGAELRAAIHALKGSVSSVGADRLTAYCNRVSGMNDAALRSEARNIARALRDEFLAVREALAEYLAAVRRSAR